MPARFETQRIENPAPEEPIKKGAGTLDGGFRGDLTPIETPLNATDELSDIRFERKGIRKDFGWRTLGGAAASRIIGLIEHKFIENGSQFHRLIRAVRTTAGKLKLEVWDGLNWVADLTTVEDVPDILLSTVSIQGKVLLADGTQILSREEITPLIAQEDDFPAGNSLTTKGDSTSATVSPASSVNGKYEIHYSVDLTITSGVDVTVILGFEHNGVEIEERSYFLAAGSDSWPHEILEITRTIEDGDALAIRVKDITSGTITPREATFFGTSPPGPQFEATKQTSPDAINDRYLYHFDVNVDPSDSSAIVIFFRETSLNVFEEVGRKSYASTLTGAVEAFVFDGMGSGFRFGMSIESPTNSSIAPEKVTWDENAAVFTLDVHGFNKATDLDAAAGVTYDTEGVIGGTFAAIPNAPAARFLFPFGNRVIALRDGTDPQVLSWPINGDVTDWLGEGSGSIILIDSRGDPIDDLMGGAALSSNYAAIFRKRSIMRGFLTGNAAQAIGVTHWIEGVGTECPFSIRIVPGGIIFLGHDYQVYYLTETAFTPIGEPVQQELIEVLTSNLEGVESVYDPIFHEYMLGIPENGASRMTKLWAFDFQLFTETQRLRWRTRPISATRLAVASKV